MVASPIEVETPRGMARVHLHEAPDPSATLVLGHGAGGGIAAPDLAVAAQTALSLEVSVALVEQPYRVAGRRSSPPAPHLDEAWTAVIASLPDEPRPLIVGGRSAGARVACRTAMATGAVGVLCLAFPLQPPRRAKPAPSRLPELELVTVPTLIIQGRNDAFGIPPGAPNREVVLVEGDHGLRKDRQAIADAISRWLAELLPPR
jgi:predicted alpha/beta-hydrolase family hydrolase